MIPENYQIHGGDIYTRSVRLDFSANINPLGPPEAATQALIAAANPAYASVYPDPHCRKLAAALAEHTGVKPEHLLCTAGASDFITRLVHALRPQCALVTAPCFSGYERALASTNTQVKHHVLERRENFALTDRILGEITSDVELVMLCSPNNPTGLTIELSLIERVLERTCATGTIVMLDETFLGFTDAPSARPLLEANPHLVIVDALTKLYALAGVRVGFGMCADEKLLARIERAGAEWAVSTAAQMAGVAALTDARYVERTRAFVAHARTQLAHDLQALGCAVIPGEANYLLFQVPLAADIFSPLLDRGILIRPCGGYGGLDDTWYRVTVRTPDENRQLVLTLKEVIS